MIQLSRQPDALLRWMGNLADPTRLRILRLLERQELGVTELCDVLQMPQSTVSRHLKLLADEKWVNARRQGTTNYYRMILDELDDPARQLWLLARTQTEPWATLKQDQLRLSRLRSSRHGAAAQAFFAGEAGQWDRTREEMYGTAFGQNALLALTPASWTVADLGCGTGAQTAQLSPLVQQVIGVDNSKAMLSAARKRTGHLSNVELRHGDLAAVPIESGQCDAAMLVLVLTYFAGENEVTAVLTEMVRILKPGGQAVVVDLLRHDREDFRRRMRQENMGFEPVQLKQRLEDAGLDVVCCQPLPPEPQAKGPALLLARAQKSLIVHTPPTPVAA